MVVIPPSFTLNDISVFDTTFETMIPVESTVIDKSLSAPSCKPPSFTTPNVPEVVSFAFDLR